MWCAQCGNLHKLLIFYIFPTFLPDLTEWVWERTDRMKIPAGLISIGSVFIIAATVAVNVYQFYSTPAENILEGLAKSLQYIKDALELQWVAPPPTLMLLLEHVLLLYGLVFVSSVKSEKRIGLETKNVSSDVFLYRIQRDFSWFGSGLWLIFIWYMIIYLFFVSLAASASVRITEISEGAIYYYNRSLIHGDWLDVGINFIALVATYITFFLLCLSRPNQLVANAKDIVSREKCAEIEHLESVRGQQFDIESDSDFVKLKKAIRWHRIRLFVAGNLVRAFSVAIIVVVFMAVDLQLARWL